MIFNFAWTAFCLILLYYPQGLFALYCFYRSDERATPDLGAPRNVLLATAISFLTHFLGNSVLLTFGLSIDLGTVISLISGSPSPHDLSKIVEEINRDWLRIALYYVLTILTTGLAGLVWGRRQRKRAPQEVFINKKGIWTFLDVVVQGGTMFRGIYHSHTYAKDGMGGYLGLVLASRFRKSGEATTEPVGPYRPIRGDVSRREIAEMILGSFVASLGKRPNVFQEARQKYAEWKRLNGKEWRDYVEEHLRREEPQFVIPWSEVTNLNIRLFKAKSPSSLPASSSLPAER